VVINILRINTRSKLDLDVEYPEGVSGGGLYDVSGMFEFITAEDRENLVAFLKENIP